MKKYNMTQKEQTISKAFSLLREGEGREGTELIYREYYKQMYATAFAVLKDDQSSHDAVHNVMAKLLSINTQRLPNVNELGWLYAVVKNEAINLRKKNSAILPLDDSAVSLDELGDEEINALISADSYQKMISGLDPDRQEIVTLKVLCGFTHREIAEITGKPVGTVQWLYATAIAKLKKSVPVLLVAAILTSAAAIWQLYPRNDMGNNMGNGGNIPDTGLPQQNGYTDCLALLLVIASALCIAALIYVFVRGVNAYKKTKNK